MRTQLNRPARAPLWIVGITICLLTPLGIVAIARSIPASYANVPAERAPSRHETAMSEARDTQADLAAARGTISARARAHCSGCGVIQSMRQIERSRGYETTVRFRDGHTAVFNETTPRTWRTGGRVIVIGGSTVPANPVHTTSLQ
jgi:hypothetical protein